MAIDPRAGREKEESKAYSWRSAFISYVLVLAVMLGSFAAGAFLTFLAIALLKDTGHWPRQINTKAAGEFGGVLFGMLPALLIANYISSRRARRRVDFDMKLHSDASGSAPNSMVSAELSGQKAQANPDGKKANY